MRGHERGVSLIEILAATFLISIAIIPMLALFPDTLGINRETEYDVILSAAAIRKMEDVITILRPPQVAFDASAQAGSSNNDPFTTATITINPSANYFVILIGIRSTTTIVSTVTVGGIPATLLLAQNHPSIARRAELWRLQNPPTGSVTVTVTMSGSIRHAWVAASFKNVDAATPLGGNNSSTGNSTGPNVTISPRAANSLMVGGFYWNADVPAMITQWAGQTSIGSVPTIGGNITSVHSARETTQGAAGVDLTWTNSGPAEYWVALAAELRGIVTVGTASGTTACTDLPNCRLVWATTTEFSSVTQGVGTLSGVNVTACQDTNGNSVCDPVERQMRYDVKVSSRP